MIFDRRVYYHLKTSLRSCAYSTSIPNTSLKVIRCVNNIPIYITLKQARANDVRQCINLQQYTTALRSVIFALPMTSSYLSSHLSSYFDNVLSDLP